ncbi:MAG TPA: MFS transporter [Opitutaceae bacterium]|nr:MFS transporter [Opitutaceae bacterium]
MTDVTPPAAPKLYRVGTLTYTRFALLQVVFWMLWGDFFFQLLQSMVTITPLLLRWHGASDATIGLVSGTLSSVVAFFWYPVVATQSDRHRGPLGRRRPFLLWCTPPVVLSMILLGMSKPAGLWLKDLLSFLGPGLTANGCTIGWISVFVVVFLLFNAYIVQVFACLIADVIPEEVMGKFTGIYRAVGAVGSLAFNRWGLGYAETHTVALCVVVGALIAVAFTVIIWNVKEGEYPPPPPKAEGGRLGAVKDYVLTSFRLPFYLNFFAVTFFWWASLVPLNYVVFFGTQAGRTGYAATLGLSLQDFGEVKGWTFIVQIPVFFIVGFFVDRFHPVRVATIGMLLVAATYFGCYWLVQDRGTLLLWWCLNQVAIAVFLGAASAMSPRLLPRDRYGQFVSANLIFGMIGLIFAPPLVGWVLEWLADYRYSFMLCGACCALSFVAMAALQVQWQRLGGEEGFVPPDPGLPAPVPSKPTGT